MTKLSAVFMAAAAALTAVLSGAIPASAEAGGGMLAGAQIPSTAQNGAFVHRGKAIVWVPNDRMESNASPQRAAAPKKVVVREKGSSHTAVQGSASGGAFVQNGKTTTWIASEDLAGHLRNRASAKVVLLGGAEVYRDLLADLSGGYVLETGAVTQPPAVTREGAFVQSGKTLRWIPRTNSGPLLGQ